MIEIVRRVLSHLLSSRKDKAAGSGSPYNFFFKLCKKLNMDILITI